MKDASEPKAKKAKPTAKKKVVAKKKATPKKKPVLKVVEPVAASA
jgi:hypothetical protein